MSKLNDFIKWCAFSCCPSIEYTEAVISCQKDAKEVVSMCLIPCSLKDKIRIFGRFFLKEAAIIFIIGLAWENGVESLAINIAKSCGIPIFLMPIALFISANTLNDVLRESLGL